MKAGKDADASSYSSDEGEEVADLPIAVGTAGAKGPRMSVSAEVFGKFNQKTDYQPPVYPKSDEQI